MMNRGISEVIPHPQELQSEVQGNQVSGTKTEDPVPLGDTTAQHIVEEPQQHRERWPIWRHQKKQCFQY